MKTSSSTRKNARHGNNAVKQIEGNVRDIPVAIYILNMHGTKSYNICVRIYNRSYAIPTDYGEQ